MEKFDFRRIVSGVTALLTAALSVPYDTYADLPTDISAETHISETVVSDNGECIETKEFIFEDNAKHYYAMPVSGTKRAEKWIDRIPDIPEYALNYYHLLEESTNNDGVDDFLIDMSKAEISNGKHVLFSSPVTFTVKSQAEISSKLDEIADEAASWLSVVYSAFERDNPQVFWLKSFKQITVKTSTKVTADGYSVDLQMGYIIDSIFKDDYNTLDKLTEAIDNRDSLIESITGEIPKNISTQKKILAINEYLTTHNSYNSVVASGSSDVDEYVFTCLTALNGTTGKLGPVCEGYSKAFKVLCDSLNIPCIIEEGVADGEAQNYGGHMWNMIKLGSEWYGVDVTWNDPLSFLGDNNTAKSGREGTYFMFSGSETKEDGIAFNVSHISENAPGSQDFNFLNSPLMSKTSAPFELVYGENDITKLSSYYDKADFGNGFLFVAPYESEFTFDEKTKVALKHGESYIYKPTDKTAETIIVGENSPYTIKEYGICGNDASWRLTDDGLLLIDGDGEMFDYDTDNPPEWDEFADEITSVKISGISYIGSYAFRNCNELEEIELPDDIEIGSLACNENSPLNLHVMEDGFCVNCGEFTESPVIKDDICQISNVGQLYSYFSDFTDYDALLMNDITVNDSDGQSDIREWISAENYNSTFDGNGNTIYGLYADSSAVSVGFVSDIGEKGTVKNLMLDNVQFSGKTNVGAVCGKNLGRISECTVKGIGSADYVGGICAENKGTVELCTSSFTADTFKVCGGICAYNYGDCSYTLSLVPETVAVGISSNGTEKACYDLSEECSDAVKSGEAAYMLSQGGMKCGQLIGKDEYPDTENADISVYKVTLLFDDENTDTAILYTNDSADIITEYLDTLPMEYSYIPVNLPDEITEDTEIEIKVKETDFSILLTDLSQKAMSGVKLTVNEISEDKEIHLYEDIFTEEEPVKISGLARNKNYRIYFEFENENITTEPMDIFIDKSGVLITDDEEKTDNLLIIECGLLPVSFACVNEEKTDSAEFRLDRFNGKVWETIAVINTSDELYPTQLLTTGKYSLRMTSAPYGCCLSDETVFSIDSEGNIIPDKSNTGHAEIKDGVVCVYAEKLVLKIKAVDSYGETVEMNAVITDSEGNAYKTEKDKDILVCRALNVPDLYTVEILSDGLDRYIIPEKLQLNIDSNGKTEGAETDEDGTILIKLYEKSTLSIEVISTEGNVIKGCEYAVIDNSGNEIAKLISATELSSIMLEPDSMYIIKETGVSEGYLFDEHSITIETDSKGNIITEGYENGKIIITKMKKPVVNIEITDQYKKAVEGAEVVISAENGSIETYTSDSSIYTAENITKPGKYTITVHAVPSDICESYEEYSFKVDENGNVISECSEYNDGVFTIQLESYTEIEVNALNSESLKNISGALLSIQSANDISFTPYEFTSDSKTETVRLPSGEYYIECVKAPFGYFKPARVDFTVDKSGENQPIDIEFDEVSIRINYNAYGKSEFEINDNSGETVKEISVENGISEWIKGLGIGINYVIRQTLAPVMHDHNPDIEFSIEEDGKIEIDSGYNASAYDNEIYIDGDRYLWTTSQPTTTTTTT
ncbi:MAG: hypothetical protein MJ081_06845, partial [Ruminococcus sp.]|nr:hypothetical protein [Ruminococcus sp.]